MANNNDKKILNVPNLRFPEFTEEWKKIKVSELLDFYSTNSLSWEQLDYSNGKIKNLHYGLIHKGVPTMVDVACDSLPYIKEESMPKSFTIFKEGDVAFADASEDTNDVAKAIEVINCDNQQIVSGLHTIHGRDNSEQTVIGYKGYAFASDSFHKQIRRIAQGTKVFSISTRNFDEVYIGIPSKEEQTKIAKLLIAIDKRIATQNKIIEDLKKLNSAINQIIFCNATLVKIQNLCEVIMGQSPSSSSYNSNNDGLPLIQGNLDIYDGVTISRIYTNEPTKISLQNDLILTVRAPVGIVAKNKMKVCIGRGVCALRNKSAIPTMYIYYALDYSSYKWKQIEQGSTFTSINGDNVKNFVIPLVDDAEYSCAFLSKVDALIKCLIDLHSNYIKQKQYLLSQLFI